MALISLAYDCIVGNIIALFYLVYLSNCLGVSFPVGHKISQFVKIFGMAKYRVHIGIQTVT